MMDLTRVHKKVAEAQFFLEKLIKQEARIIGDKDPFDYYLSAFLSAVRTVDYRLRCEQGANYDRWRKAWEASLDPKELALVIFVHGDRAEEVHKSGSRRNVGQEGVDFGIGEHRVDGGILTIFGPPCTGPAIAQRPTYNFTIDGTDRKVSEVCAAHLALTRRMVAEFDAAPP
jgi:hypothetical protein